MQATVHHCESLAYLFEPSSFSSYASVSFLTTKHFCLSCLTGEKSAISESPAYGLSFNIFIYLVPGLALRYLCRRDHCLRVNMK